MTKRQRHRAKVLLMGAAISVGLGWLLGLMPGTGEDIRANSQTETQTGWVYTGSLNTSRASGHTATRLRNGQILIAGGMVQGTGSAQGELVATSFAELFDPITGTSLSTPVMASSRSGHTATLLDDGQVLLVGGINEAGEPLATAELFDPVAGVFLSTGTMTVPRARHLAVRLGDGRVLIAGGEDGINVLATAEIYDPSSGTFSSAGTLVTARTDFSGVLLPSGDVLALGGYGANNEVLDSAEVYDLDQGAFLPAGFLGTGRTGRGLAVPLLSGDVLVVGGGGADGNGQASVEIFSPQTGTFSSIGSLSAGRHHHTVSLLPNGQVLVAGGWQDGQNDPMTSVELFDAALQTFSVTESLQGARGNHTATVLDNGAVFVAGGSGDVVPVPAPLSSVETFSCPSCLAPPEPPTQVMASDVESDHGGAVLISWGASTSPGVREYRVYISSTAGGPYTLATTLSDPSLTTSQQSGLTNGASYYFVLRAFDGIQESVDSNEAMATPLDNFAPEAPSGLSVADKPQDEGTALVLSWTPSPSEDVVEQRVYRSLNSGGPYSLIAALPGNTAASFVDSGLITGTNYFYALTAFNGTGESLLTPRVTGIPQDNRPVATSLFLGVEEDGSLPITLSGSDDSGNSLSYEITQLPLHGQLSGLVPVVNYVPVPNFHGVDRFSYVVHAGMLTSLPAVVEVTVSPVNDPPLAENDVFSTEEDAANVFLDVLANDTTAPDDGERLFFVAISPPNHGGLVKVSPQQEGLLYSPAENFAGTETFSYTVFDGVPGSEASATVTVTVSPVNDAPLMTPHFLSWTPSPSPDVVEQRVYRSQYSGGPYQLVASLSDPTQSSFLDTKGLEIGHTYYYVVKAYNQAWLSSTSNEISGIYGQTFVGGLEEQPITFTLPAYDPDGDELSVQLQEGPQHGVIQGEGLQVVYTPDPQYVGTDHFTYTLHDGSLSSQVATVFIDIGEVNDPPVAHSQTVVASKQSLSLIHLTGDDGDPYSEQSLQFVLDSLPAEGALSLSADGPDLVPAELPLTLNSSELFFRSPDNDDALTFHFHVEDDGGTAEGGMNQSSQATVTVNLIDNQPPSVEVGAEKTVILPNGVELHGTVSDDGFPSFPGKVTTTWTQVSGPGMVTFGDINSIDTTATFSQEGVYTLRLEAHDGGAVSSADVTITVEPAIEFTAYNDLAWGPGQFTHHITTITSPNGGSGLASSGMLIDFDSGMETGVTLTVSGGEFNGTSHATEQGAEFAEGEALANFGGKVSGLGAISYLNDANDSLVLSFSGLDATKKYEVVFAAQRAKYDWARASLVTLVDAESFANVSSFGSDNPKTLPSGVLFSGVSDPSTRLPADNPHGYVARFVEINPGTDGEFRLIVTWDGEPGSEYKGKYASAVMLRQRSASP